MNNKTVWFNKSITEIPKCKQKQCHDCLTEAYLHKLFSTWFKFGGKTIQKSPLNYM